VDQERPPAGQVAVFIDFGNLVLGAGKGLPSQANPVPYAALTRLCRDYGNAKNAADIQMAVDAMEP
jgi:hypothetical protein